ncbi:GDSL-type esterase/lipase family protein [Huintestinicola sp.]|uniref:GDSL-type esterase/lipase family protein n=1 Tax=Huintestinicola sp. TaxID=2981661 RepID=UPI003D7DBB5D
MAKKGSSEPMSDNTIEGAKPFRGKLTVLLLTAAVIFSGCGQSQEPVSPKLPSITDYSREVSSIRSSETSEDTAALSADSETVSAGDAASRQTEADTSAETLPSETAAAEPSETETTENTSAQPSETKITTSASSAETSVPDLTELAETHSEASAPSSETVETIKLETECSVPAASAPVPDTTYDSEFFSSDLFIGDSISTGYSLYGFLDDKNVYAKVGLNPSTVLTKSVSTCYGEIGISTMLSYTMPKRVYIMLGSNGIQWLSVGNMLQSTDTLVDLIKETCPDCEVVIISVPPVTAGYDSTVDDVDVMAKINEYNTSLRSYCTANNMLFVDAASILKDETGYFNSTYAESDGMHFKSSAYKTLLSKIQSDVTEFEEANAEKAETEVSDEAESETETEAESVTEAPAESETTPAAETFLTLPETTEKNK